MTSNKAVDKVGEKIKWAGAQFEHSGKGKGPLDHTKQAKQKNDRLNFFAQIHMWNESIWLFIFEIFFWTQ